ncbi:MAG TPA: isoleucine--tRNA ligase [Chitinophagaceae bacterium]|nr:MAG: isoleucyl-tRNA synthase [Bacteroidetes bacterium OLB11]HMN32751.1 isoleucine--tRNA ligase [Chitinophagaceae bacterium]
MNYQKYNIPKQFHLPSMENEILKQWNDEQTFQKSVANRSECPEFVFYEGPPSANGMPGIHHVISRTLKDMVCRYKTMRGFQVNRKAGWDTHGLPVELGVEKELGITKEDIGTKITVEEYNQKCREAVVRFKDKWDDITNKMGYWVDLQNPYVTYHNEYIETLWWCLKELHQKGYLYKSVSIQPYSPAAGTGLSSHELNQPGCYKDVKDTSATVLFKIDTGKKSDQENQSTELFLNTLFNEASNPDAIYLMAWTTTPWTLPSNLGLTVGEQINYVLIKTFNPYTHELQYVILAENLISKYFKKEGENQSFDNYSADDKITPYQILSTFKGKDLENIRYHQLLPFESNKPFLSGGDPFRVILGDFVTTDDGTGIVHTAPAFGADDYKVGQKNNLGIITLVDKEGKFIDGTGNYSGRFVKNYKDEKDYQDVNVDICIELKKAGLAFKVEKYDHSYPHCWRTDKPIIYYPLDAWFIKTTAVKERMIELNKTINWKPKATGEGRFGNWLENMVDWNLSRSRFWGTPLPIWKTEDGSEEICCGSIEEIKSKLHEESPEREIKDLHKPYIDQVILKSSKGEKMYREKDLIDVWFDSGAMPYAQWHFPFDKNSFSSNATNKPKAFPADFIAEGVDQTRGWFYTLHALAVLLFDSVAYKTVIANGLVLDKHGNKMSKRLGNVVNPFETIHQYGADATRWYLITNASPWDSLKFDMKGIEECQRKLFNTLYNTYTFFALYANVDHFTFKENEIPINQRPELDRWILSSLNTLISEVQTYMDEYEPTKAGRAIDHFVDEHLSNWYVRLCRRRFWKGEYEFDKISAYQTLYECLETLCKLIAPISPFFSEWLYKQLNSITQRSQQSSIHLCDFPTSQTENIDKELEQKMDIAQVSCSLLLSLRKKSNIKVRQPLQKAIIPLVDTNLKPIILAVEDIIKSEVNIKEITFIDADNDLIKKKAKANFKTLGARLAGKMKLAAQIISSFTNHQILELEKQEVIKIQIENDEIEIFLTDVEITSDEIPGLLVANKGSLTIALDTQLTPDLIEEGIAREFVNKIQKIRKDNNFELTDKIEVVVEDLELLKNAITRFYSYICTEILAANLYFKSEVQSGTEIEINEHLIKVSITNKK